MKRHYRIILFIYLLCTGMCLWASSPVQSTRKLIERITPGYSKQFVLKLIDAENGQDVYEISGTAGRVVLSGNNAVSLATAYNQYLKYTCHTHLSWFGNQLNLPKVLPAPATTVRQVIQGKYRVYMNYCTVSYSAPWWDWKRWERELDYMAMNSINMPLSVVGLEGVWYNTLLKYGFSDVEARTFLTAPGHFAWQWMQNIQSYGGPLPKSWIEEHVKLGKKIMARQLELGMQPIQQGFSGYVPREFKEKFPHAKIKLQGSWCGFKGAAQLDPTDSLFTAFGRDFLKEEKKLYGAHGVYAADPFHESAPPVNTPEYLSAVGHSIHHLFKSFDPKAIWAMQAWSLREPIVKAVPMADLLILDLNGGKSTQPNACWGYPVVAGNLHNFGGRINLHGDLQLLASNQYEEARKKSPNVCGSGLFMEAIGQNPIYYDLAFEMPVHTTKIDLGNWIKQYTTRRYGKHTPSAQKAWEYLLEGPYRPGTNGTERSSIIAARPALDVKKSGPNAGLGIPYSPLLLIKAERLLLENADALSSSSPYRFDIVDVQRQLMSNLGQAIHKKVKEAFEKRDIAAFKRHTQRFQTLLRDVDILLRTRDELNFDKWLTDARQWGKTTAEKDLLERDATALVTIWGADGDPVIFDYSWREWSGLIEGFYLKRWEMFHTALTGYLERGESYIEKGLPLVHGREAFRANELYNRMADWEMQFVQTCGKARTPIMTGDEVETARKMFNKYVSLAKEYYSDQESEDNITDGKIIENFGEV